MILFDSKKKQADIFLKNIAKIIEQNPNIVIDGDFIYHYLIFNDVKANDKIIDLSNHVSIKQPNLRINPDKVSFCGDPRSTFNNWIQYYANSEKTDCFVSPNWLYFCQFISKDYKARKAKEHIKVYIPLDGEHIEFGAQLIFDFLEKNNIPHLSKIGKRIRFDDIVVRLIDKEDADKLLQFVKNNKYIKDGLIKPNPFAFQENGVAMASDGDISYNQTVAGLISDYLQNCRLNQSLKNVDVEGFYNYVSDLYKNQFVNHSDNYLRNIFRWQESETLNYQEVISLILQVRSRTFNYRDFIEHYETCKELRFAQDAQRYKDINELLIESCEKMTLRFNKNGLPNVEAYYITGDQRYITSQNNLRQRLEDSNFRQRMGDILSTQDLSFTEYTEKILKMNNIDLNSLVTKKGK